MLGGVNVGNFVTVHSSAVINHKVVLGDHSVVGASSFVISKVKEGTTVFGSPGKKIKFMKTIIIAEAGVNHNGSVEMAMRLIEKAKEAGADYVKFQTGNGNVVSKYAQKANYQKVNTNNSNETQAEMLKKIRLKFKDFILLKEYCDEVGIKFLSTPFDFDSIDFLATIAMDYMKIPSGEITNYPYLVRIAQIGLPIIMSTGMCTLGEIESALTILEENGVERKNIILLHCNTEYPTPFEDVNLRAMLSIGNCFGVDYGYSDHTKGIEVPIAAVALGAKVIEKHFTLDRNLKGPDHIASLEPDELKRMVDNIRNIEKALGSSVKKVSKSEYKNISVARKSIIASKDIKKGELFTVENITTKRPGNGVSPMLWNEVLGLIAKRDFSEDELIEL